MAKIRREQGDPAACVSTLRRVLGLRHTPNAEEHGLDLIRVELGRCLVDLREYSEAEALLVPIAARDEPVSRMRSIHGTRCFSTAPSIAHGDAAPPPFRIRPAMSGKSRRT